MSLEDDWRSSCCTANRANPVRAGALRWLGRLFLEKPMPFALAATCVELVAELRGPAPEPAAKALTALVRET